MGWGLQLGVTRRQFLKLSAATGLGATSVALGAQVSSAGDDLPPGKMIRGKQTTTICPYCATGCGFVVTSEDGKVVNIEGDPDHPINRGAACAKGAALAQLSNNPRRLGKVLYRASGARDWQEKEWDWAIGEIAKRLKATRDATWTAKDEQGRVVNRTEGLASLGGAALDNEECYALVKAMRGLGLTRIEHQARV